MPGAVNLRRTLAVRFGLTMAVALLAIAVWVHAGVERALRDELEQSLVTSFLGQSYAMTRQGAVTTRPETVDEIRFVRDLNRLVAMRDSGGRVVQTNTALAARLPLDTACLRRALYGDRATCLGGWEEGTVLSLGGPVPPGPAPPGAVLQVAASTAQLERASHTILWWSIGTALLAGLATVAGASWLTRSALRPVEEIAAQAQAIRGEATGERITVHANVTELQGLIAVLNEMLGRLDRVRIWHRRILRDLGHDLRTPITAVRTGAEVALRGERRPEDYRRALAGILEEGDRLGRLAEAVTLLGRLETGELAPQVARTDLHALATAAVSRARAGDGDDTVHYASPADPVEAIVDPRLIALALDQLLDNARRHTPAGTRVDLGLCGSDGQVRLTVEDRGPGVPAEAMAHLFDRFYRADPARGRGGPGLGLAIVAAIVRLHRGRVAAEQGDGGGLRVVVDLPVISGSGAAA